MSFSGEVKEELDVYKRQPFSWRRALNASAARLSVAALMDRAMRISSVCSLGLMLPR